MQNKIKMKKSGRTKLLLSFVWENFIMVVRLEMKDWELFGRKHGKMQLRGRVEYKRSCNWHLQMILQIR